MEASFFQEDLTMAGELFEATATPAKILHNARAPSYVQDASHKRVSQLLDPLQIPCDNSAIFPLCPASSSDMASVSLPYDSPRTEALGSPTS